MVARKPLIGTVAANVLEHGTGALNIDGCRIDTGDEQVHAPQSDPTKRAGEVGRDLGISDADTDDFQRAQRESAERTNTLGRWPANVVLSEQAAEELDEQGPHTRTPEFVKRGARRQQDGWGMGEMDAVPAPGDEGGPSRFFYCAKTSRAERNAGLEGFEEKAAGVHDDDAYVWPKNGDGSPREKKVEPRANHHPTVKPINLMRWLVRLVTPPGGTVLDPFLGSGTTGCAAALEGFDFIGIEREAEYVAIAEARIAFWEQHEGREIDDVLAVNSKSAAETERMAAMGQTGLFDLPAAPPPDGNRDGEASAARRYTTNGGSDFAMKPGKRRRD